MIWKEKVQSAEEAFILYVADSFRKTLHAGFNFPTCSGEQIANMID